MSRAKRKRHHEEHDEPAEAPVAAESSAEEPSPDPEEVGLEAVEPDDGHGDEAESPENEIVRLQEQADQMRALAQRKQAEFENYRRRMERERADLARHAGFEVVREVLPVLDNLERAIRASESSPEETFRAGVEIIYRQFQEILVRMGLSEVESLGQPFDPHVHEAVTRVESEKYPDGVVVEVFQKGYLFKDRLLRPAMVSVAQSGSGGDDVHESPEDHEEVASGPE